MEKSSNIVEISKALVAFHKEMPAIKKSSQNPFFKSKYAALENIIEAIEPVLSKNNLTFVQVPSGDHGLTTILMHTSGEFFQDVYTMTPAKNDPQGIGSAITYMKRYALAAILGLKIEDEDDDGNAASGKTNTVASRGVPVRPAAPATPEDAAERFAKAKNMVSTSKNIDGLLDYIEKLKGSKNFTATQRTVLTKLANERIEALQIGDAKA